MDSSQSVIEAARAAKNLAAAAAAKAKKEEEWAVNFSKMNVENYQSGDRYEGLLKNGKRNKYGVYTWADGRCYKGQWKDGDRNGQGICTHPNGSRYEGDWKDGLLSGHGVMTYEDGSRYEGEWQGGQPSGYGVYTYAGGACYEGEWQGGLFSGQGVMTIAADGSRYIGEWKDGKKNGQGVWTHPNGSQKGGEWKDDLFNGRGMENDSDGRRVYEGDYRNGKRDGYGVLFEMDGGRYDGNWKDGKRSGRGVMTYADGRRYDGNWKDGQRNGQGVLTYADGRRYDGEWKDGKCHGHGVDTLADGRCYDGEWKDGKPHGHGVWTHPDGRRYDGEWKDGKIHGRGVMTYADGSRYDGEWKDGKFHGRGVDTFADGSCYDGEWKDGKRNGQGVWTHPDGRRYDGAYQDGKKNGHGVMTWKDGGRYEGEWKDGRIVMGQEIASSYPCAAALAGCSEETALQQEIRAIQALVKESGRPACRMPEAGGGFPTKLTIGTVRCPADLLGSAYGYETIEKNLADADGMIALPLVYDLEEAMNLLAESSDADRGRAQELIHHVMWRFLSAFPATTLGFRIFDCEKQGASLGAFLAVKEKNPDLFDIQTDAEGIYERLKALNAQIADCIQNKLRNKYPSLLAYNTENPTRSETIQLLVIHDFPSGFDARNMEQLVNIVKNGGSCGIYTVIHYNRDMTFPETFSRNQRLEDYLDQLGKYMAAVLEIQADACFLPPFHLKMDGIAPVSAEETERFAAAYSQTAHEVRNRAVSFRTILDAELFSRSAGEALEIPVGLGDEDKIVPLCFGRGQSHHALVAGSTGSGKSTLLHTLIMSALLHYSPDELHLYLMDFKGGTEFQVYDPGSWRIPHIKLLALDAKQEFGESILEALGAEIEKRSETFKEADVSNLSRYVEKTGKAMPRILVIIDEFQVLFDESSDRKVAQHCASLAKDITTRGRSYGIHLLMATQSTTGFPDLSLSRDTIGQMRIHIGLKCGEADARELFGDTRALELMKGPIGTAVMNPDYPEGEMFGFRVVFCDETTQREMLQKIAARFADLPCDTQVFEGNRTTRLLDVYAEQDKADAGTPPKHVQVEVGELIKVAPPLCLTFDQKKKHHVVICGGDEKRVDQLFYLLCLGALKHPNVRFYCMAGDLLVAEEGSAAYYAQFKRFGDRFRLAETWGDIIGFVNEIYDLYRKKKKGKDATVLFVGIKNFQWLELVQQMMKGELIDESEYIDEDETTAQAADPLGGGDGFLDFGVDAMQPDPQGISAKLLELIDRGSTWGIHFILTCTEAKNIREYMYYGENALSRFPERFLIPPLSDEDAGFLAEEVKMKNNMVYYTDSVRTFPMKPYVFPEAEELAAYLDAVGPETQTLQSERTKPGAEGRKG